MKLIRIFIQIGLAIVLGSLLAGCSSVGTLTPSGPKQADTQPTSSSVGGVCDLSKLTLTATWQGATGSLAGVITLANYTDAACSLQGSPKLEVVTASGLTLPVQSQPFPGATQAAAVTIQPKAFAQVEFTWRNWCGDQPKGGLRLALTMPGVPGTGLAAVEDPNGNPLGDTPRCDASNVGSVISAGPVNTPQ